MRYEIVAVMGLLLCNLTSCDRPPEQRLKGTFLAKEEVGEFTSLHFSENYDCTIYVETALGQPAGGYQLERRETIPCTYTIKGDTLTLKAERKGSGRFMWKGILSRDKRSITHYLRSDEIYLNEEPDKSPKGFFCAQSYNPYATKIYFGESNLCQMYEPTSNDPSGKGRVFDCTYSIYGKQLDINVAATRSMHTGTISRDATTIVLESMDYVFVKQKVSSQSCLPPRAPTKVIIDKLEESTVTGPESDPP